MAEDSGQERTEEPTSKRLEESRKKGEIARSRELNTFVVLLTGAAGLMLFGARIGHGLWLIMRQQFQLERAVIFDPHAPVDYFSRVFVDALLLIAPFIGLMVLAAALAPLALGGWAFSGEALMPKFEKLNPIRGLGRMFSLRGLVELIKSILKFFLILAATVILYHIFFEDFLALTEEPLPSAITHSVELIALSFLLLSASLLLIAIIDVPYQLWDHRRKLKMTRQEVRDEMKETDGRPEVKSRIRRLQMEMAQRRMMEEVPKADVVVTNPTHFAVALKYDQAKNGAPVVLAKGADLIAAQIRNIALSNTVPLVAAPPLARALYHSTKMGAEVPKALYLAVAQVLAYVYQLKAATEHGWEKPQPPTDLPVPDDMLGPQG